MQVIKHHAIIVTSMILWQLKQAKIVAEQTGLPVSHVNESPEHGFFSFTIMPDGAYEHTNDSMLGDDLREEFIEWLNETTWEFEWAYLSFGGTDIPMIINYNK